MKDAPHSADVVCFALDPVTAPQCATRSLASPNPEMSLRRRGSLVQGTRSAYALLSRLPEAL